MRSMRQLSGEKPEKRITIQAIWKQLCNIYLIIFPMYHKSMRYNTLTKGIILKIVVDTVKHYVILCIDEINA